VVEAIRHKAASPPHMDGSIIFAMLRQYVRTRHPHRTNSVPRFEYIDCGLDRALAVRDLGFSKKSNFCPSLGLRGSKCVIIPWRSVELEPLLSWGDLTIFQNCGRSPSWILKIFIHQTEIQ